VALCVAHDAVLEHLTPTPRRIEALKGFEMVASEQCLSWCSRYKGGSLFEVLDNTDPLPRDPLGPFRMSVIDKYKEMGTIAMGKSEAGIVRKNDRLYVMPNK
jgi:translation elongation factor EF-1alpha